MIVMYDMFQVDQVVQNLMFTNINLINKYQHEMALRKKLHNELVELKGRRKLYSLMMSSENLTGSNAITVRI